MSDIYLLTFSTEGPPYDSGYPLSSCALEINKKLSPYFKEIFCYTPRTLKQLSGSEQFCNEWPEPLDMNPNANLVGYFDFKSFLIDYTLSRIPDGSILMYHDGNFRKNPQYWQTDWPQIKQICETLLIENQTDIFMQFEQSDILVKKHVKNHVLRTIFPDNVERNLVEESKLVNAARIILRKSELSVQFIKDYMSLCLNKELVAKSPDPTPHIDFKWSCGDQDVLNALVYRYILDRKLPPAFPRFTFLYRVIRLENRPFTWDFPEQPHEAWHHRPHMTGIQILNNQGLIDYLAKVKS